MIALFFNNFNFDQPWAQEDLAALLHRGQKVTILPVLSDEGWASDADYYRQDILQDADAVYTYRRPFLAYALEKRDIRILDFYDLDPQRLHRVLADTDVLVLAANDASAAMHVLEDQDLAAELKRYDGILIGIGAGALMLMQEFRDQDDEVHQGLDIARGFGLLMNYQEKKDQLERMIRQLESEVESVIVCPDQGGFLFDGSQIELLGNAFIAQSEDLDAIYQALEDTPEENADGN